MRSQSQSSPCESWQRPPPPNLIQNVADLKTKTKQLRRFKSVETLPGRCVSQSGGGRLRVIFLCTNNQIIVDGAEGLRGLGSVSAAGCLHYKNKRLLWYQNRRQSFYLSGGTPATPTTLFTRSPPNSGTIFARFFPSFFRFFFVLPPVLFFSQLVWPAELWR